MSDAVLNRFFFWHNPKAIRLQRSLWPGGIHDIHQRFEELIIILDLLFVFDHIEDFIEGELIGNGLKAGVFIEHFLDNFFCDGERHVRILPENRTNENGIAVFVC